MKYLAFALAMLPTTALAQMVGTWTCEMKSRNPYEMSFKVTQQEVVIGGKRVPVTWAGQEAKFEWQTQQGHARSASLSMSGGQAVMRIHGAYAKTGILGSVKSGKLAEFVHHGTCKQGGRP
jgi:hypothetical protein